MSSLNPGTTGTLPKVRIELNPGLNSDKRKEKFEPRLDPGSSMPPPDLNGIMPGAVVPEANRLASLPRYTCRFAIPARHRVRGDLIKWALLLNGLRDVQDASKVPSDIDALAAVLSAKQEFYRP